MTPRPGAFCWFELATTDRAAAKTFYESLFGWTGADMPIGPTELYTIFKKDGRDAAAGYTLPAEHRAMGMPPNWLVYVLVENADEAAARAAGLGAKVGVAPFDVMEQGRMAVIEDPAGARFAIWQAKQSVGVGIWGETGGVSWVDLQTTDQSRAGEFYSALFGWKMVEGKSMNAAKPGDYYHIVNGTDFIGGISPAGQGDPDAHPAWMMYVEVADCAGLAQRAASLGARVLVDTMKTGENGSIAVIADPQGAVFALHESTKR